MLFHMLLIEGNPTLWQVTPETARLIQHWRHFKFNGVHHNAQSAPRHPRSHILRNGLRHRDRRCAVPSASEQPRHHRARSEEIMNMPNDGLSRLGEAHQKMRFQPIRMDHVRRDFRDRRTYSADVSQCRRRCANHPPDRPRLRGAARPVFQPHYPPKRESPPAPEPHAPPPRARAPHPPAALIHQQQMNLMPRLGEPDRRNAIEQHALCAADLTDGIDKENSHRRAAGDRWYKHPIRSSGEGAVSQER